MTDNSPAALKARRSQNTLIIVGTGIIVFSIWTLIKTVGMTLMNWTDILTELRSVQGLDDPSISDTALFTILMIVLLIYLGGGILLRLFVGLSAIAEGLGKRRSILYILAAAFMIWSSFSGCLISIAGLLSGETAEESSIILQNRPSVSAMIIELTSLIMMVQMVVSAIRIRWFRKTAAPGKTR